MELQAREGHAGQVLSEQRINIKQLSLQQDKAVVQSQQLEQLVGEACSHAPELEIVAELPVGIRIHKLASGFREAKEEAVRIQLVLNMQIAELKLQVQPLMPPEVTEKRSGIIKFEREMITRAMRECTDLLDQSLITLTSVQEDPTLQRLEMEAREIQQAYDNSRGNAQTVSITQRLAKMREAQALKIQVDASRQKETVIKECLQPWLDEAFVVSTAIECKVAHMQAEDAPDEVAEIETDLSAARKTSVFSI